MDIQNISFEVDAIKGQYTQNLMRQVRGCCSTAGGKGGTSHALVLQYESLHCTSIGHSQSCRRCTFLGCSQCTVPACCLPACLPACVPGDAGAAGSGGGCPHPQCGRPAALPAASVQPGRGRPQRRCGAALASPTQPSPTQRFPALPCLLLSRR
jgi:hypothetical protein